MVYFTHDYFANAPDKNSQLLNTIDICKFYNVKNVIAVNPIEYVNYYNNDGFSIDALNNETQTHNQAM